MAISSVDMDRALSSASYAQQVLRSGNATTDQKGQLAAKWGADNVNKWLSVDGTEYQIDDVSYDNAKEAGKQATKDSVGYDGGKTYGAIGDAVAGVAVTTATALGSKIGTKIIGENVTKEVAGKYIGKKAAEKAGEKAGEKAAANVGAWVAATLAAAEATRYLIAKPNKEQHEAGEHLMANELPEGQNTLNEAQGNMSDASEEITELTEEAQDKNDEANEKIEEDKTLFDFYRQQYEALKAKKESGGSLTPDEQALMKELAPLMEDLGEGINETSEETSEEVNDLNDTIGEYQDVFDESGETIAEVEGMTDYAEGFDENTRTMCYVEAAGQGLNALSAGIAVGELVATNIFGINTPFILLGTYAAGVSGKGMIDQIQMAGEMTEEIHYRRETQEVGTQTTDMYTEELDNYAGNIETVEDLELEIPDDLEVPQDTTGMTGTEGNANPFVAARVGQNGQENDVQSPLTAGDNNNPAQTRGTTQAPQTQQPVNDTDNKNVDDNKNDNKKKPDEKV